VSLGLALAVGLLQGSLHCAGMCGPFVLAFALSLAPGAEGGAARPAARQLALAHLAHNAGRIFTFTLLGAVFGELGAFVDAAARLTGVQAAAGVAGGGAMVAWAVDQLRTGHGGAALERWSLWRWGRMQGALRTLFGRRDAGGAFACGALLGLHPCGLLFAMLLAAAATGSALRGAATLLAFGAGTVPALLGVALGGTYGARRLQGRLASPAVACLVALTGVVFLLRGLAINGWVPHVWPWLF
jgi:sulfite exporter TauE/SafE